MVFTGSQVSKGFSLVEVLIASVILFSSIALTSQLYKQVDMSSEKATILLSNSQIGFVVIELIKTKIQNSKLASKSVKSFSGQELVNGISYPWNATLVKRIKPPRDIDDILEPQEKFSVFNVVVSTELGRKVEFNVTVWD
ncbi:type IV pilus modification PilV family protein [Pseudoalteromonas xiamenensis]